MSPIHNIKSVFLTILKSIKFVLTNTSSMRNLLLSLLFSFSLQAQDRAIHWQKPDSYVSYAPFSTHYFRGDIARTHLTSINYGWAELGFFINSYREPTFALCYKTEVLEKGRWRVHLMAGTAYGYKKNLYNYPTIPLSGTILFKTDFVPVGGGTVEYFISEKVAIKATFIPLVGGLGLQYDL